MSRALAKHKSFLVGSAKWLAERAKGAINQDNPPAPRYRDTRTGKEVQCTAAFPTRAIRRAVAKFERREFCVPFDLTIDLCKRFNEQAGIRHRQRLNPLRKADWTPSTLAKYQALTNPRP